MTEWYAIKSRSGAENDVLTVLEKLGMTGYLPVELIRINHRTGTEVTWRALFDGYLFAQFDPGCDIPKLREIDGVQDILRSSGGRLSKIPDEIITVIRAAEQLGSFDRTRTPRLAHGDDVVIQDGPFAHLVAKIKSERPSKRMKRCMELVGNFPFRMTADVGKVEKVA